MSRTLFDTFEVPNELLMQFSELAKQRQEDVSTLIGEGVSRMLLAESVNKPNSHRYASKLTIFLNILTYGAGLKFTYEQRIADQRRVPMSEGTAKKLRAAYKLFSKEAKRANWIRPNRGRLDEQFQFQITHFLARLFDADANRYCDSKEAWQIYFNEFFALEEQARSKHSHKK